MEDGKEQERPSANAPADSEKSVPSSQEEEAVIKKKYGGIMPKKPPLISKDHERAYFDSADWALGKVVRSQKALLKLFVLSCSQHSSKHDTENLLMLLLVKTVEMLQPRKRLPMNERLLVRTVSLAI